MNDVEYLIASRRQCLADGVSRDFVSDGDHMVDDGDITDDRSRVQVIDDGGYMAHACWTVEIGDEEGGLTTVCDWRRCHGCLCDCGFV